MRAVADALFSLTAGAAVAQTTVDVVQRSEPYLAGAAQSLVLAAIVGALCGVYFHQSRKGAPILPPEGTGWRLVIAVLLRVGGLGLGVLAYAYLTAVSVTAVSLWRTGTIPPLAPPLTGILGCFIIPLLPAYQSALEGVIAAAGGLLSRAFGGKP